jgi:uncharacterized membrane protein YccC
VEDRSGLIFAAKTTASGLIALLVAFTFNLDQPYWALLTVFIVAQPRQSGQVLAKSFYRMVGTVIGAAVALVFVGLFAQERVLFLGALALWVGLCAFGSQYARNFAAYSFVLSGYTVAIVGIPGELDAGNAFYTATGRVTEVCLGIIVAATVNRIILPSSLGPQLWQAVAGARATLADYAIAHFKPGDGAPCWHATPGSQKSPQRWRRRAPVELRAEELCNADDVDQRRCAAGVPLPAPSTIRRPQRNRRSRRAPNGEKDS